MRSMQELTLSAGHNENHNFHKSGLHKTKGTRVRDKFVCDACFVSIVASYRRRSCRSCRFLARSSGYLSVDPVVVDAKVDAHTRAQVRQVRPWQGVGKGRARVCIKMSNRKVGAARLGRVDCKQTQASR